MTRRSPRGYMKLGAFTHPTGNHVAAWLHPDAQIDAGTNFEHYIEFAQTAERAKFDLMFLADAVAERDGNLEALSRWPQYMAYFEPLTLLSAIASVTKRIGLVSTATTSYNEPYQHRSQIRLARPDQRRPRRLERGHLVQHVGSVEFRPRRALRARRALRPRRRIHATSCGVFGTAGTTTPSCATARRGAISFPRSCIS